MSTPWMSQAAAYARSAAAVSTRSLAPGAAAGLRVAAMIAMREIRIERPWGARAPRRGPPPGRRPCAGSWAPSQTPRPACPLTVRTISSSSRVRPRLSSTPASASHTWRRWSRATSSLCLTSSNCSPPPRPSGLVVAHEVDACASDLRPGRRAVRRGGVHRWGIREAEREEGPAAGEQVAGGAIDPRRRHPNALPASSRPRPPIRRRHSTRSALQPVMRASSGGFRSCSTLNTFAAH